MYEKKVVATANLLSRRNASSLANTLEIKCKTTSIFFTTDEDRQINAKSLLGLLSIACSKGTEITVKISGKSPEGEKAAMEVIETWFEENSEDA